MDLMELLGQYSTEWYTYSHDPQSNAKRRSSKSKEVHMRSSSRFVSVAASFVTTLSIILLVSVAASAYTLVTRSGRRIQIPAQFTINANALTYEVAPGITVTLQLAAID